MTVRTTIRIGTRRSRLALEQASRLTQELNAAGMDLDAEIVEVRTHGDSISERHPTGGFEVTDGQFTAELERAVLRGEVDVAVHSYKDLPTAMSPNTAIAAVLPRADARDCLLSRAGGGLERLPSGAAVGTSSVRRALQLLMARPDLVMRPIRGNVETRIARMQRGEYDAVVLAAAGMHRLGISVPAEAYLSYEQMLPAPAQGALAVQVHADRDDLLRRLRRLDHPPTRVAVDAERSLLREIGGGCLAPLGALGVVEGGRLRLRAVHFPASATEPTRVDVADRADRADGVVRLAADAIRAVAGGPA